MLSCGLGAAALAGVFGLEPAYLVDRKEPPPLDAELLEGLSDETTREITREALRLPGRFRPVSLDDAFARFAAIRRNDALYAVLVARAPEVTRSGRDYPELPLSALALLASGQSAGDDSRRGDRALLSEIREGVPGMLRGEVQLELAVDPRTP